MKKRTRPPAARGASPSADALDLFAVTALGLEPLAAAELRVLGAGRISPVVGGVGFTGSRELLYRANLHLRTASRVLARVAEFHASAFHELERRGLQVAWERWIDPTRPVDFRVTARKSRLYHSDAVAERLLRVAAARLGVAELRTAGGETADDESEGAAAQLIVVRLLHDTCTVSADSSGALLHLRGYRQAIARAPLRETIAAAMLLGAGWDGTRPLVDPMCGSGTIAIEAALLARRIAPGLATGAPRAFAFERWPGFERETWERIVAEARAAELPASPVAILASDRDAGAVEAAGANAERARVAGDVAIERRALTALEPPPGPGALVSNPPYGVRVGERDRLRDLYAALGRMARERLDGWTVALLTADRTLEGHLGLPLEERFATRNGGIPVRLMVAEG